jgi:Tfp pilus assembly protein PilF
MAIRKRCINCGAPVSTNGYCTECRLPDSFLQKAHNTSVYHYNIALDKAKIRDISGAIESLRTSLRYDKKNIEARNLLGLMYYETGEMVNALNHWVMSINIDPRNNIAVRFLKSVRDDNKQLGEADNIAKMFNTALEYAEGHSFDLAVIQLRRCISVNKHFVKAYLLLGLIEYEQGRIGKAKKTISRVLTIDRYNPTAMRYLREMGESEGDIVRNKDEAGEDELFDEDYYGVSAATEDGKRPARKIELPERQKSGESTLNRRYRRLSRARMSNVYVLIGVLIGIAVFYLLIVPVKDKNRKRDISKMEASYSEKLASKNAEADNLIREKDALQSEIDGYKENETKLNDDITGLEKKIKDLQALVAEYKDKLPDENTEETTEEGDSTEEGDTESTEETQNEKYDVDGISDTDVDNMIDNE